jgi:hypothetical protein
MHFLVAVIIALLALPLANCSKKTAASNPKPILTSLSPSSAPAGSRALTITVTGSNFITGSVIRWNGSSRTTTYVSNTQLTGAINPADLSAAGSSAVTVFNPTPGGGASTSSSFAIATVSPFAIATTRLPDAYHSKAYSYAIQASGGISPYTLSITGSLPSGLSFTPSSGLISGTPPTVTGNTTFSFTASASDFSNTPNSATQPLSIVVRASSSPGRNDTYTNATPISNGVTRASISPYGDIDVYSFQGTKNSTITAEIYARRLVLNGDPASTDVFLDSFLEILNSSGTMVAYNDDISSTSVDSLINYKLASTGTYYIRVSDLGGGGRPDFIYELRLSGAD